MEAVIEFLAGLAICAFLILVIVLMLALMFVLAKNIKEGYGEED